MKLKSDPLIFFNRLKSAFITGNFINGFNRLLLGIIPLIFIVVWFLFHDSLDSYYYTMMDPEYAYLFNGITVIENHGRVDYYDHPGTPLEVLMAVTIQFIHIFRDEPLMDDVLKNPELYLKAMNVVLVALLIAILFFAGRFTFRRTGNLGLSLLVQATPLPFGIPHFMARVIPETLAILLVLILIILIMDYIVSIDKMPANNKHAVLFSIIIAVILATKISMFPLFFIPLLLLKKTKKRLIYTGLTVILFLLVAYPVLLNFNSFFQWIKSLFMHSGHYGSGNTNILSVPDFTRNLKTLYESYRQVFYLLFMNLAIIAGGILLKMRKKIPFPAEPYNAIIGLSVCYIFHPGLPRRQFSFQLRS